MSAERELIERFYTAFQHRDAATMGDCYHSHAQFSDPVFPRLDAAGVRAMWTMLCSRGADLRVEFRDIKITPNAGSVHWEAWYTFSSSGRKVHNRVDAEFQFRDGLILHHDDRFSFHRWAAQALGLTGLLLGGTAWLQRKVQSQAAAQLASFRVRR